MSKMVNYNSTVSDRKSSNYTVTTADEHLVATATLTFTLPATSTFLAAGKGAKTYVFETDGASSMVMTINCNSADTIDGDLTTITATGDAKYIVLVLDSVRGNWVLADDMPFLGTDNLRDGAVTTSKLGADAVTGAKIADDAIDSEHYTDASIDTAHIALDAVDGTLIADDAIDSEHYTDGSIDTAHIADAQVTGAKMSLTKQYGHVVKVTSSTDPQTFTSIPIAVTITNVTSISEDTTAANIVVKNGTDTVCTIAKGVLASGGAGAFTLANTALGAAGTLTVESSVTNGDALVKVDFEATA
jgi:hypothetical protein